MKPAGYSMMQNGGDFNDLGHFHLHLFPRFSSEEFNWQYQEVVDPAAFDYKRLHAMFSEALKKRLSKESSS